MNIFTFIAVNYNNSNFTRDYIQSINEIILQSDDSIKIIIVDNASQKDDLIKLREVCKIDKNITLIESDENLGYFKGLNLGITEALKNSQKNIIIGNNDLTFEKNFIIELKKIDYMKDIMVIAPNIITKDGRQQNPHVLKSATRIEKIKNDIYYTNYYIAKGLHTINKAIKKIISKPQVNKNNYGRMIIKGGIGACYILTENFTQRFKKLDDRVFMWGEEALLSNQVESVGGKILYDPSIIVNHHESATVKKMSSKKKYNIIRESYKIYRDYL